MAYYVRKIARAKWSLLEEGTEDTIYNYKADTIANDIRTQNNTISLWRAEGLSENEIEPVVVINSLLGDTISRIELIFIPEEMLEGFTYNQEDGETAVSNYRDLHYNVKNLSVAKHIIFATNVILKILAMENNTLTGQNSLIKRFSPKQQLDIINKWIPEIDYDRLKPKQQETISNYISRQ